MKMRLITRVRSLAFVVWLICAGALLALAAVVGLSTPVSVTAAPGDLNLFVSQYPQVENTELNDCVVCHSSGTDLNPYGEDYLAQGRTMDALMLIENIDSDDDGVANKVEIDVALEPGDEDQTPSQAFIPLIAR